MQVQSFIGMTNYLSKISPRMSKLAETISELSRDKVSFNWGPEHQQAFTQMKREISSAPILQPQETNHVADRCQHQRSLCLLTSRWQTCLFWKQSPN